MKTPEELAEEWANYRCPEQGPEFIVWCMCKEDFLAGYAAAQPKWISVKERLPEWHEDVLAITVHCSFREMKVVRYEPNYGFDFNGIITHWMPLPEAPKENE